MSRRILCFALVVGILTALGVGVAFGEKKYTLKVGYILPETQSDHIVMRDVFKKYVEEKSNGQIEVQLYPNAQLGGDRELIEGVQLGTLEMAIPATSVMAGFDKRFQVFDLPFLFTSEAMAYRVLDGELGQKLNEILPPLGMINLGYGENGFRHVSNNKGPIRTPKDMESLKIRTMENPLHVTFFKRMGANPTPISFGELYTALQQKTVDAQENPIALVYNSKFYEVQKFYSLTGHVYSATMLLMNKPFFDRLPAELQEIVSTAGALYVKEQRLLAQSQEKELLEKLRSTGMEINVLSPEEKEPFVEITRPVYDEFRDIIGVDLIECAKQLHE